MYRMLNNGSCERDFHSGATSVKYRIINSALSLVHVRIERIAVRELEKLTLR